MSKYDCSSEFLFRAVGIGTVPLSSKQFMAGQGVYHDLVKEQIAKMVSDKAEKMNLRKTSKANTEQDCTSTNTTSFCDCAAVPQQIRP